MGEWEPGTNDEREMAGVRDIRNDSAPRPNYRGRPPPSPTGFSDHKRTDGKADCRHTRTRGGHGAARGPPSTTVSEELTEQDAPAVSVDRVPAGVDPLPARSKHPVDRGGAEGEARDRPSRHTREEKVTSDRRAASRARPSGRHRLVARDEPRCEAACVVVQPGGRAPRLRVFRKIGPAQCVFVFGYCTSTSAFEGYWLWLWEVYVSSGL